MLNTFIKQRSRLTSIACILAVCSFPAAAEVEELSNMEMTEAFIEDGGIVVKQRVKAKPAVAKPTGPKVRLNVGPGEPHITDAEIAQEQEQNYQNESQALLLEMQRDTTTQQLRQNELSEQNNLVVIPVIQSEAALAQRAHADDIVRNGLGLSADTQVTDVMLTQYMQTFSGQSTGTINTFQQNATNTGYQFVIPNAGGLQNGIHTSGDGSLNVEVTNQQIIWNFVYPNQ